MTEFLRRLRCRLFGHRNIGHRPWQEPGLFGIRCRCERCGADTSVVVSNPMVFVRKGGRYDR